MKGIYKFFVDCGRSGDLSGLFIEDSTRVAQIIGKKVYFGEVLGKHSEVYIAISSESLQLVSNVLSEVELIERLNASNGINPFDYIEDEDLFHEDDSMEDDDE